MGPKGGVGLRVPSASWPPSALSYGNEHSTHQAVVRQVGVISSKERRNRHAGTVTDVLTFLLLLLHRIGDTMMRTKPLIIICSAALLMWSAGSLKAQQPAPDQTPPPAAAPSVSQDVDRDHRGDWGWIGLLGLIGLGGLAGRTRREVVTTTRTTPPRV
jgi:MYXO-CTERM domain-containing protein